nr:hypothetical protein [Candidatus Thiosymbion oneisti]
MGILKESVNADIIFSILEELQPNKLSINELAEAILSIERKYAQRFGTEHVNNFGTGGDWKKTINISTMSSIIAARHFLPIVKVGTSHVTSSWGSREFFDALKLSGNNLIEDYLRISEFRYIGLEELGIPYSNPLRAARRDLFENEFLDIFKVIFPISNLTGSLGQVNGVSDVRYLSIFVDIVRHLRRNSIILHNENGIDEIFSGGNVIIEIRDGRVKEEYLTIGPYSEETSEFMKESSSVLHHVDKFERILLKKCPASALETVGYNISAVTKLKMPFVPINDIYDMVSNVI